MQVESDVRAGPKSYSSLNAGPVPTKYVPIAGGPYTGASLNPARTIGPACTFACNVGLSFLYITAEFFGGACAAGLAVFMYGVAPTKAHAATTAAAAAAAGSSRA